MEPYRGLQLFMLDVLLPFFLDFTLQLVAFAFSSLGAERGKELESWCKRLCLFTDKILRGARVW